ncbi:hypothetical protein A4X09_0g6591, partial [Tilletia walkeri]
MSFDLHRPEAMRVVLTTLKKCDGLSLVALQEKVDEARRAATGGAQKQIRQAAATFSVIEQVTPTSLVRIMPHLKVVHGAHHARRHTSLYTRP